MKAREKFYTNIVKKVISDKEAPILICGGGELDKNIFIDLGFKNVTISNLDIRQKAEQYAPFTWKYENAENLSFSDNSFDYVVIHAAIHHACSPHRVLTEMYRVARKGVLAFESRDSFIIRLLEKLHLTQTYEHAAVYYNDGKYGGVNNTEIPNYIYRWTEREVEKTIRSYSPSFRHKYSYFYGTAFPCTPELEKRGRLKYYLLTVAKPFFYLFSKFFPKQQNQFAFFIGKPDLPGSLHPWLMMNKENNKIRFNRKWGEDRYR